MFFAVLFVIPLKLFQVYDQLIFQIFFWRLIFKICFGDLLSSLIRIVIYGQRQVLIFLAFCL